MPPTGSGGYFSNDFSDDFNKGGGTEIWRYASIEAAALEKGMLHEALGTTPLWPGASFGGTRSGGGPIAIAVPHWADDQWRMLKQHLLAADEGWEVWAESYDAILQGHPLDPEVELEKVLIPNEVWKQGPSALNAKIARLLMPRDEDDRVEIRGRVSDPKTSPPSDSHSGSGRQKVDVLLHRPAARMWHEFAAHPQATRRLALADWMLIQSVMRMVPFAEDYRKIDDLAARRARQAPGGDQVRFSCEHLCCF